MSGFPDARSVVHLICKDRKELLSSCNRKSPLLYSLQCKRNKRYRMGIVTQRSFMIAKESSMEGLFSQRDSQGWYVS